MTITRPLTPAPTPGRVRLGAWALAGLMLGLCACTSSVETITDTAPVGADAAVRGTITYSEPIQLTPDAVVTMQLQDTSRADAAAVLISEQHINNPGQVPIAFELPYASDEIDERATYSVSAVITEGDGRMAFTNDTAYDVITKGNPNQVDMTLVVIEPPPDYTPDS